MIFLANPPQKLTDSIPHDAHLFEQVENGWKHDLVNFVHYDVPRLVVAFILAFAFQSIVSFFVRRMHKRAESLVGNAQRAAQLRTMASILRATSYFVVAFYLLTQVLGAIGVSLSPFIASAGVIGLGISFGAQSLFKDMLTGIFILIEDQYSVGDTVKIASLSGTVEDLSLRVTRLRDDDGTIYIIPNSQITTVSNLSRDFRNFAISTLNVSVDAREDPDRVAKVLQTLADSIRKDVAFKDIIITDPTLPGVDKISGYEVIYPINVSVKLSQRDGVMRELRRRILLSFAKEGIAFGSSNSTLILQNAGPANPPKAVEPAIPPANPTQ